MINHRLIEETFPVKEIGQAAAREKSIRHSHISTLHIWWSRKPLAASRATTYAALIPAPANIDEWQKQHNFLVEMSQWESSLDANILEQARKELLQANNTQPPRVLDAFAGGGSIPLEALRLGCETYANEYNPVATLLLKATLEYPHQFGHTTQVSKIGGDGQLPLTETRIANPLIDAVEYWAKWVLKEALKDLTGFYPISLGGFVPVGYYWMRTIPCQNPSCSQAIPLTANFWLSNRERNRVALYPDVDSGRLVFRIVGNSYGAWPSGFDPNTGTVSRAVVTCPTCNSVIDEKTTRRLFQEGKAGQQMVAVVLYRANSRGKIYRVATSEDEDIFCQATTTLQKKREQLILDWGVDPVPDEPVTRVPVTFGVINVWVYGMSNWGSLFNARQQLALITFAEKVRQAHILMTQKGCMQDFATAIATYLGILFDWLADKMSTLTRWHVTREVVSGTYSRQALPMVWDYFEVNPFSGVTSGWDAALGWMLNVLKHCSQVASFHSPAPTISQSTATHLPYADSYFDAILTDPPYYDNVPYSYLSDFFYVWLKRTVGHLHPDLFSTPLTPKANEIVAYTQDGGIEGSKRFFETNLKRAFQEMYRVLKPEGIAIIVYAHKSTAGWETVINALLDSNLVVTGAWPLNTEMGARMRAQESATLASSIYIVARKIVRQPTGFYNEVRDELRRYLDSKLHRLWEEGIGGADFFIAAIGSAIEIFGRYEQVLDYEGNIVRADRLLDEVRTIATDYAVRQILHNGFANEISDLARFYVLWRWNYGEARVSFDEARKLAQSCGLDLTREWGRGNFIRKDKEFVQVLGPHLRRLESLENSHELIDVLHRVLLLWEKSQRTELVQFLVTSGYGQSEAFYRVAQAISETLPNESKEKKLLDGFLAGRERMREDVSRIVPQRGLWEE